MSKHRFETRAEARAENRRRRKALKKRPYVAELLGRIRACRLRTPCREVFCAVCAVRERRTAYKFTRKLIADRDAKVFTVLIRCLPGGKLAEFPVATAQKFIDKVLRRCGFAEAVGAVDVSWHYGISRWIVHAHIVVIPSDLSEIQKLRDAAKRWNIRAIIQKLRRLSPKIGEKRKKRVTVVKVQRLKNKRRQLSYLEKHHTFYRVGKRAVPLRGDLLEELARWKCASAFSAHRITLGVRRPYGSLGGTG